MIAKTHFIFAFCILMFATSAHAQMFRRALDVIWDAGNASGDEIGWTEFYTNGHLADDASDLRVTTESGRPVPFRMIMIGPGDLLRIVFQLTKGETQYAAYFGDTKEMPPGPRLPDDAPGRGGLLMEMRHFAGGSLDQFADIEAAWQRCLRDTLIGRTMVERPFVGWNPFGDQEHTASRFSGSLFAAQDGEYQFAGGADDRGALYLDGQPLLFIPGLVGDIRFNAKINLTRGRHDFVAYHYNGGGDGRFSIAWKVPSSAKFDVIARESFGISPRAVPGSLEELKKTLTADFTTEYLGECFYDNHYSHRIRLSARPPKASGTFSCEWDFGDGQTSRDKSPEHVFLTDGVYPVRLTTRIGNNSNSQTIRISVTRDLPRLDRPPEDQFATQSQIVASYDVKTLPLSWLTWAVYVNVRAGDIDAALRVADRLCTEPSVPEPEPAIRALVELSRAAFEKGKGKQILASWGKIATTSNLQPRAVRHYAQFLVWWAGDFSTAVRALETFVGDERDDGGEAVPNEVGLRDAQRLRRLYGQALILAGKSAQGREVLEALGSQGGANRQVVIAGALARTIEHFIDEKDYESGEDAWERWQTRYPADFLEGHSVLLRTRLIEIRNAPEVAARVAEAFATNVPQSAYAPLLLDRAAKLLEKSDPQHAEALRVMLKKNYPEHPLSQ